MDRGGFIYMRFVYREISPDGTAAADDADEAERR
jgi:hypothetical protein